MTTVADLGEFGIIARLTAQFAQPEFVATGVGDDAAVIRPTPGKMLLATCDAQVQDIHFRLATSTPEAIGWRSLAINISDIAAMGGTPRFALISLLLPATMPIETLDGIYRGLGEAADVFGVALVGGNVALNPERLIIDISLLGEAAPRAILHRNGARPGDAILVTGSLGCSAAGFAALEHPDVVQHLSVDVRQTVILAHQRPQPRVVVGQWLANHGATAALDISDGLAADLWHICEASKTGAVIDAAALPIIEQTSIVAQAFGRDPIDLALFGGEDYELLFTAPAELVESLQRDIRNTAAIAVHRIGTIQTECAYQILRHGVVRDLPKRGWDHLRGNTQS